MSNFHKKYIFTKINLFSRVLSQQNLFEKMLIYHWSPNSLKFWFLLLQWPPLLTLTDFKWGQFFITFWSEVSQGYSWGKILKMKGFVPNQHWPTDFIWSSKKLFLQTHIISKEHYLSTILNFCPELKLYTVFKKSFKFQSQKLGIQLWSPQFSKFPNSF